MRLNYLWFALRYSFDVRVTDGTVVQKGKMAVEKSRYLCIYKCTCYCFLPFVYFAQSFGVSTVEP